MAHNYKISVIGLGYVGLNLAAAFGKNAKVIGFDISAERVSQLKEMLDLSNEVSASDLKQADIYYSSNPKDLHAANFHIICVSTPLNANNKPDIKNIMTATEVVANNLKHGDIVVYESTFYPGFTEQECIPKLEQISGMTCGSDFAVAYSPERVNPGDKVHTLKNIVKVVAATDPKTLAIVSELYATIIDKLYPVATIRIAEATKILENIQRDINIAFMNEATYILHGLGMEMSDVYAAMQTKWNSLPFKPGMVGGHCLGSNCYYLLHGAERSGFKSTFISEGRKINEHMPKFIVEQTLNMLTQLHIQVNNAQIGVLGLTFKENCEDLHDSGSIEVINMFKANGAIIHVHDPIANPTLAKQLYDIDLQNDLLTMDNLDAVVILVAHQQYMSIENQLSGILIKHGLVMDTKGFLNPNAFVNTSVTLWRI